MTAGDVGFHYVVRALTEYGRSDVLAEMFSKTDSPSYGYQLAKGATTLTEAWDANPTSSQNHFMLGHGEEWFYRGLAGLLVDLSAQPSEAIIFHPDLIDKMAWAHASYQSPMGLITIRWQHFGNGASIEISVPPGARASLDLPAANSWLEGNEPATRARGVIAVEERSGQTRIKIGSGEYRFTTEMLTKSQSAGLHSADSSH